MEFAIPSKKANAPDCYLLRFDLETLEIACACPHWGTRLWNPIRDVPYKNQEVRDKYLDAYGTFLEHEARARGEYMLPLITRKDRGKCCHLIALTRFIKRHGWYKSYCLPHEARLTEAVLANVKRNVA